MFVGRASLLAYIISDNWNGQLLLGAVTEDDDEGKYHPSPTTMKLTIAQSVTWFHNIQYEYSPSRLGRL